MQKVKIFQLLPNINIGGAEKLVIDIVKNLNKEKYDVTIISMFAKYENVYTREMDSCGIRCIYLNKKLGFSFKIYFDLIKVFFKEKPDVVHTHRYVIGYAFLAIILSNVKIRLHTVHTIANKELPSSLRKLMWVLYKWFGFIPVAISKYNKKTIVDEYRLKPESVICIYNGIDTAIFKEHINAEMNSENIVLVNVGRFEAPKNHDLLIDSFFIAYKKNPILRLVLIGDGILFSVMKKKVESLGINDVVDFKGNISNVVDELNKSDIFILSSDYEGLPLTVIEAMSCGLPIITTRAGGVIDIVNDEENGVLIDVGDEKSLAKAILRLSNENELRIKMGSKSLEMSKDYDLGKCISQYEEIYNKAYN